MCGEDDDGPTSAQELHYERFVASARALLTRAEQTKKPDDAVIASIETLFEAALSRAVKDCEAMEPERRYETLAMQSLVFARLAGVFAGHLPLDEDPLRRVMAALMHGYDEAGAIEPDHGHSHDGEATGHFGHSH